MAASNIAWFRSTSPVGDSFNEEKKRKISKARDSHLASRGTIGSMVYPVVYLLVAYSTGFQERFPEFHLCVLFSLTVLSSIRLALCLNFSRLYPQNPGLWRMGFLGILAGQGTTWGLLAALAITLEPWTPASLLFLFAGSGLAGGTIATSGINRVGYRLYLFGILIPPGTAAWLSWGEHGTVLAAFHAIYFLFLWLQGSKLSLDFERSAINNLKIVEQRDQLERAKRKAENASMAKSRLLANVSHELRTPLNAIIGTTEWSLSQKKPQGRKAWQEVHDAGLHLLNIIDQVLDFAKIESGQYSQAKREPFPLYQTVRQVERLFAHSAREKKLALRLKGVEDTELVLLGDDGRLRQVLCNLVGNAIKFTDSGWVELEAKYEPNNLTLWVRDSGPGIPDHYLGRIFEPFSQADDSLTRKHGGTGLGLTISQDLAISMGGELALDATNGKGTTFRVSLPLAKVADSESDSESQPRSTLLPYQVLVVDDDSTNRHVAKRQLRQLGLRPTLAEGATEAVKLASKQRFDFILMDLQMPETDGYEATRTILSDSESLNRNTPIIALTAHTGDEEEAQCLAAGMISFLNKPLRKSEIIAEVKKLEDGGFLKPDPNTKDSKNT